MRSSIGRSAKIIVTNVRKSEPYRLIGTPLRARMVRADEGLIALRDWVGSVYWPDHLTSLRRTSSRVEGFQVFPRSTLTQCSSAVLRSSTAA